MGSTSRSRCSQVPKRWQWVSSLPRNAMGKVNKKELLRLMQEGKLQ